MSNTERFKDLNPTKLARMNYLNKFYNAFDTATLEPRSEDYRTEFEKDRDRIIHSSAFRRLQAKTQVFLSGEYDFYRTRLTHSLEVSQIGRSICAHFLRRSNLLREDFFIDPALVEAACLAHDIGHPPFGHAGERTLNDLMKDMGGFEGNAQTLRVLSKTFYTFKGELRGMKPTRALVDAVLKYKRLWVQSEKEKHFLYDEQGEILDWVFKEKVLKEDSGFSTAPNDFRSIECQIMNWADDIAYSVNDVADGTRAGFIDAKKVADWAAGQALDDIQQSAADELIKAINEDDTERFLSMKIGEFIQSCSLAPVENFMSSVTHRYAFALKIEEKSSIESGLFKQIAYDLVFKAPQLVQLEAKGDFMLRRLFEKVYQNYLMSKKPKNFIAQGTHEAVIAESDKAAKARLLCDYFAGMTDHHAAHIYRRFFDPNFGSLVDLI